MPRIAKEKPLIKDERTFWLPLGRLVRLRCEQRTAPASLNLQLGPVRPTTVLAELQALGGLGYTGWTYNKLYNEVTEWTKDPRTRFRFEYTRQNGFSVSVNLHSELAALDPLELGTGAHTQVPVPQSLRNEIVAAEAIALASPLAGQATDEGMADPSASGDDNGSATVAKAIKLLSQVICPVDYVLPGGAPWQVYHRASPNPSRSRLLQAPAPKPPGASLPRVAPERPNRHLKLENDRLHRRVRALEKIVVCFVGPGELAKAVRLAMAEDDEDEDEQARPDSELGWAGAE